MKYKYIIIEVDDVKIPVIFGELISHKAAWQGIIRGLRDQGRAIGNRNLFEVNLVSAGFVGGIGTDSIECYGESESLRYGIDYIPKEEHETTKSHPEEDLRVILGGKLPDFMVKAKHEVMLAYVVKILKKEAPEAKHKSPADRWRAAVDYVKLNANKPLTSEEASAIVADVARTHLPIGAYKIA